MTAAGDDPGGRIATRPVTGLLWNPLAGRNRRQPELLEQTLATLPIHAYREAVTPPQVSHALAQLAAHDVDLLIISGGDGTVQAAMTCLFTERPFARLPPIILLPSGTTNMDARDIGVRGRPRRALARLHRRVSNGWAGLSVVDRPVLCVTHGDQRVYGFFFGTGLITEAVDYFQARIRRWTGLGQFGSLIATLRTLARLLFRRSSPVAMTLDWGDGQAREGGWALVLVTSLERVLFRTRPYHDIGRGPAHMTAARYPLRRALVALMRTRRAGDRAEADGLCSRRVSQLELLFDDYFVVDGECYPATAAHGTVSVTIAGERVRFLVP